MPIDDGDGSANDSDDSDFEGQHANAPPLVDFVTLDEANALELSNIQLEPEAEPPADPPVTEPETAIEPNRGQKYMGQGKTDKTVWWSMPAESERIRCWNLAKDRDLSLPIVTRVHG